MHKYQCEITRNNDESPKQSYNIKIQQRSIIKLELLSSIRMFNPVLLINIYLLSTKEK